MNHADGTITLNKKQLKVLASVAYHDRTAPRENLEQVFFDFDQGYAAATDGHRAVILAARPGVSFIPSHRTGGVSRCDIVRLANFLQGGNEACFSIDDGKVRVMEGGKQVYSIGTHSAEFPPLNRAMPPARGDDDTGWAVFNLDPLYLATLAKIADALITKQAKKDSWKPCARCTVPDDRITPFRYEIEDHDTARPAVWTYTVMPIRL